MSANGSKRFKFATRLSAADAAKFASELAAGLTKGELSLHAEEQSVTLAPAGDLRLKVSACECHCKTGETQGKIKVTVRYQRKAPAEA